MKMNGARYGVFVLLVSFLLMASGSTLAHESWLLTPEQMLEWNMKPRPEIFTKFSFVNTSLLIFSTLFFGVWLWWDQKENRLLFPGLQARLASYGDYASLVVRCSLALMLIIAAFGLNPRHGTAIFEAPTLIAPDLEIRLLDGDWLWLGWTQAFAAVTLVLGLYVRLTAVIILLVSIVGIVIFGYQMWAYAGIVAASAVYLFMEGAGTFYIRSWIPKRAEILVRWLERQSRDRAQFLTRILTGVNLAYLGIEYKFFQPNLSMAFLELQNVFTFGLEHSTFTFCMFLVETLAGILLILGALTRLLSVILFIAFFFIAHITGENPIGHVIVYGILFSMFINGAGCWSPKTAGIKLTDCIFGRGNAERVT